MNFDPYFLIIMIIPLIFAITVHEAAHGYAAKYCGDNTAEMMGRLSLNPIRHIDPIGTIAVPLGLFLLAKISGGGMFLFGWAKPVPVNPRNYTRFSLRKSDILVSFAGPASNLLMMFFWAILIGLAPIMPESYISVVRDMASFGMSINAVLFTLNMLPIMPLDGGHILDSLLPVKLSMAFRRVNLGQYGFLFVILLLNFGPTRNLFYSLVDAVISLALPVIRLTASLVL